MTFKPLGLLLCWAILSTAGISRGAEPIDFNRDIRPILAVNCFACHGPDDAARKGELRLDVRLQAVAAGAISPGKPNESELITRINSDDLELRMPPPDSGHSLTGAQKELLKRWIAGGSRYDTHWSFTVPQRAPLPAVHDAAWPRHAVDHFVLARLEKAGLEPAPQADRYTLIRRVSLDLTGLPPTPEQADAFHHDQSERAYEKVVDRLLDSDAYGEHWARMWLDLARYADTKGYEKDRPRQIWRYRDWVIDALNRDLPFDRFTIEQLAGDLLPDPTTDQQLATAFHRNTMTNDEGGTDNEEFRVAAVKDRVDTTMQVWMGLTMGCAKCHSHKYDPISMADYYSFFALLNQTEDADRGDDAPLLPSPTEEQKREIDRLQAEVDRLQKQSQQQDKDPRANGDAATMQARLDRANQALAEARAAIPKTPVLRELPANKRRETRIHIRGNFLDKGAIVDPGVPEVFGNWPAGAPRNRLGMARWLMQPENPLTARVMVNRIWARLFGTGLVETEEDFGTQGQAPSHPELLDWLAVDFRENGWSWKKLLRTIVLSSTYRQSAASTEKKRSVDPQNRLLSRGPRFRLPAETIRDQALFASGLLTVKLGGPSVMPPQPPGIWKSTYSNLKWETDSGGDRYRRALYTYWKRTSPYPAMITFDAGTGEVCQIRRVRTNTPLQALVTLNDPAFVEAAGALARRMEATPGTLREKLTRGFRLVLIRPPDDTELARLSKLHAALDEVDSQDPEAAARLLASAGRKEGSAALLGVANVLLNLDETLMKP